MGICIWSSVPRVDLTEMMRHARCLEGGQRLSLGVRCAKQGSTAQKPKVGGAWHVWGAVRGRYVWGEARGEHRSEWGQIGEDSGSCSRCGQAAVTTGTLALSIRSSITFSLAATEHSNIWMYHNLFTSPLFREILKLFWPVLYSKWHNIYPWICVFLFMCVNLHAE